MVETTIENKEFSREHWTNFVSGLPEGFVPPAEPEPRSDGSDLGPPTITAAGVPASEPNNQIKVTPLEYSMPNPNSRFGTHPAREVYSSGHPNWFPKDTANRITFTIDKQE